jgi:glycogen debranching enzyme
MSAHQPTILFVQGTDDDAENSAAWTWLASTEQFHLRKLSIADLVTNDDWLRDTDVVWWHALELAPEHEGCSSILRHFLEAGGGVLLSLRPCTLLGDLGLEPSPPRVLASGRWEGAVGEHVFYGLMDYQGHPIFDDFFGGVYLWQPRLGETFCEVGYPDGAWPSTGKVVAVRRVFIGIEPEWKLALEYDVGRGRLLAIGAYLLFDSSADRYRPHLERFVAGCLRDLARPRDSTSERTYWVPKQIGVVQATTHNPALASLRPEPPPNVRSGLEFTSPVGEDAPFDLSGRRLLLLASERGPIREIWAHPFRIWQNLRWSVAGLDGQSLEWQGDAIQDVWVRPEAVVREGRLGSTGIRETIVVSSALPVAAVWLEVDQPARLRLTADTDFRLMWPYDAGRLGTLFYSFPENLHGVLIHDQSGTFTAFLGASQEAISLDVEDTSDAAASRIGIVVEFDLAPKTPLVLLLGGTNEGVETCLRVWNQVARAPSSVLDEAVAAISSLRDRTVHFDCSDKLFADAVEWALLKTATFFVDTPRLGSGWMAGYHTTRPGWNSGRPGYAWYFGRDGVWTSLGMLAAGDFESVRSGLRLLGDYQEFTGKIFHELTTSGVAHYDAADSTPLYLILMARYLEWSGDLEFVRSQWSRIQKALEFCFSTDRDGDGLIENSGVGHGWIEGGKLYGAHVTLELAGMWAACLDACERLAEAMAEMELAAKARSAAERVRIVIDTDFWNSEAEFYHYAKMPDGTFHPARTILASVPILFGATSPEKADSVLRELARSGYSADWGVRMLPDDHPDYDPRGYHQGSVWPLFTGWVSLAEYHRRRPTPAFAHLYGNVWNYLDGAKGCIEEVLDGDRYQPAGVCPHQAWSESMVLQPLLEGMLGLHPDAQSGRLRLAPQWPPHWTWARLENLRLGDRRISVHFERRREEWLYRFDNDGAPVQIGLDLSLPPAAAETRVEVDGQRIPVRDDATIWFNLEKRRTVRLWVPRFLGVVPPIFRPRSGQPSRGFRVVDETFDGRFYKISCDGRPGASASIELVLWGYEITTCQGGEVLGTGQRRRVRFRFPKDAVHKIVLELRPVP